MKISGKAVTLPANQALSEGVGTMLSILDPGSRIWWLVSFKVYRFTAGKRTAFHCEGNWVGLEARLDLAERSCLHWIMKPATSCSY